MAESDSTLLTHNTKDWQTVLNKVISNWKERVIELWEGLIGSLIDKCHNTEEMSFCNGHYTRSINFKAHTETSLALSVYSQATITYPTATRSNHVLLATYVYTVSKHPKTGDPVKIWPQLNLFGIPWLSSSIHGYMHRDIDLASFHKKPTVMAVVSWMKKTWVALKGPDGPHMYSRFLTHCFTTRYVCVYCGVRDQE